MAHEDTPDRVALLTGAAGGIGTAIALALARQGWRLVLTDRDATALHGLQQQCAALAPSAESLALDVTREDDVAATVRHVLAHYGRLDGVISNAGIAGVVRPVAEYPMEVFVQTMAVNATGTFLALKHGLPALHRTGGGSFVAVGSTSSIRGRAHLSGYVASKHAVLGLVRSAALETVGTGVRVNAVLPGPTQTAMIDAINAMADQDGAGAIQRAVTAPYAEPMEVADTVSFLLSPASRHMNGAALVVDGGSTLA
jgi:NAD(P)-dependent dehydrogenase (short-subunit alcohol dehydrogenase family)